MSQNTLSEVPYSQALPHDETAASSTDNQAQDTPKWGSIFYTIIINALPNFICLFSIFFMEANAVTLIKREDNSEQLIGAYGLALAVLTLSNSAFFLSLSYGLTSFISQAFGAKKMDLVGLSVHRALVINHICMIPISIFLYFSVYFYKALGFDDNVAELAQTYLRVCIIASELQQITLTLQGALYGCDKFFIPGMITTLASGVYYLSGYIITTNISGLGIKAPGYAFICMQIANLLGVVIYIKYFNPVSGLLVPFQKDSLKGLWHLFKHQITVGWMSWGEFVSHEIEGLYLGWMNKTKQAGYTTARTVFILPYPLPEAIGNATLTFAGNAIGERNKKLAKRYIQAGLTCAIISIITVELVLFFFERPIIDYYAADAKTASDALNVLKVYFITFPLDFQQIVMANGIKGVGKEKLGSLVVLCSEYFVGVPLSYYLCFHTDLGLIGIPWGSLGAVVIKYVCYSYILLNMDWEKQIRMVQENLAKSKAAKSSLVFDGKDSLLPVTND